MLCIRDVGDKHDNKHNKNKQVGWLEETSWMVLFLAFQLTYVEFSDVME